jgi:6-phosphogluconolactonase
MSTTPDAATARGVVRAVVHPDADVLAEAVAARLLTRLVDVQSVRDTVHLVLTGGTVGIAVLAAAAASPVRAAVDWSSVHLWWGDERFVPAGHPERNETQAREALVDSLVASSGLPRDHVHPMLGPDAAQSPEESAAAYAAELALFALPLPGAGEMDGETAELAVPAFDVLLLGMGPDGHVASLFPGHDALGASGTAVGVHESPKPPPERVSLTFGAIRHAREVWIVASGEPKAVPVANALAGAPVEEVPAAGVRGTELTLWLLDAAAASPS